MDASWHGGSRVTDHARAGTMEGWTRPHVTIHGEVQGVGYRYTMKIVANEVGVTGWVRNRRDGTVEAEVEGTPDQIRPDPRLDGRRPARVARPPTRR